MLTDASLPSSCREFRQTFVAGHGQESMHPRDCPPCAAWVVHRQAVHAVRREQRPLPATLGERLRAIPNRAAACVDPERLVRAARIRARGGESDPAVWAHVAGCSRCRIMQDSLGAAFARRALALPPGLEASLSRIALRGLQQGWAFAFDLRAASVAALLVGLLLIPVAGPAAALARDAGSAVSEPMAQVHEAGTSELGAWLRAARGLTAGAHQGGRRWAASMIGPISSLSSRTYASFRRIVTAGGSENPDETNPSGGVRHDDR